MFLTLSFNLYVSAFGTLEVIERVIQAKTKPKKFLIGFKTTYI